MDETLRQLLKENVEKDEGEVHEIDKEIARLTRKKRKLLEEKGTFNMLLGKKTGKKPKMTAEDFKEETEQEEEPEGIEVVKPEEPQEYNITEDNQTEQKVGE